MAEPISCLILSRIIKRKRIVKISQKESLLFVSPACISGVLVSVPNFNDLWGRRNCNSIELFPAGSPIVLGVGHDRLFVGNEKIHKIQGQT